MPEPRIIYKYPVALEPSTQTIQVRPNAKVLSTGLDPSGDLCVWVEGDMVAKSDSTLVITLRWTGDFYQLPTGRFVGSVTLGMLVWHVFVDGEGAS